MTTPTNAGTQAPSPIDATALATSNNAFAVDLYRALGKQGNVAWSPASVSTALAMTWGGARGQTADEMGKVLHFAGDRDAVIQAAGGWLSTVNGRSSSPYTLRVANRLFGDKSYAFQPAYLSMTNSAFGAGLESTDFRHAPDAGRERINAWVDAQTEHRIANVIPQGGVDATTRLVLVNAIYFLADWASPFKKESTLPTAFTDGGASKQVAMMNQTSSFAYAALGGVKVLDMPYKGGDLSMTVILPDATDGLAGLERSLTSDKLDRWIAAAQNERVSVALPKFEVNPAEPVSLAPVLGTLGMRLAFDPSHADFTGMANPPNPDDRLFVAKVFHKAFVKVDEKGTEAAAATAVVMATRGMAAPIAPAKEFRADHPFLFLVRDRRSGMILFMGRVTDPKAA